MVTAIRERLLWVFAAVTVTGLILLLVPFPASLNLIAFRAAYGSYVLAATVLSASMFLFGGIDALIHGRSARPKPAVKIVPLPQESWWHEALQPDGRKMTQIDARLSIYNESETPVRFAKVQLISPRVDIADVRSQILLPHPDGHIHSSDHPVLPGRKVTAAVHLMIGKQLGAPSLPLKVKLQITDQHATPYRLRLRLTNR